MILQDAKRVGEGLTAQVGQIEWSKNQINSPTNSLGWTSFTTTITGTTTNPSLGTIVNNQSYYLQQGKVIYIYYLLVTSSAGSAGSY